MRHKMALILLVALAALAFVAVRRADNKSKFVELPDAVRRGLLLESVYGIGTVESSKSFALKLAVASTVKTLYVKEGDQVKRGQKLVDLEGVGSFSSP